MGESRDDLARQLSAACQAAAGVLGEWAKRMAADTADAFGKLTRDPSIRAAVETGRAFLGQDRLDCQCVCSRAHPDDPGVCDHNAVTWRRLDDVEVPLCAPCAVAQGISELPR